MQTWLIYTAVALIFFLAITLPILARPDLIPDKDEDIRAKLYTMERKIRRLENALAKYEQAQNNPYEKKRSQYPEQRLRDILQLSSKQDKYITHALATCQQTKTTSQKHLWEVLDTRERIMSVLTPIQREKYINYLLQNPDGF